MISLVSLVLLCTPALSSPLSFSADVKSTLSIATAGFGKKRVASPQAALLKSIDLDVLASAGVMPTALAHVADMKKRQFDFPDFGDEEPGAGEEGGEDYGFGDGGFGDGGFGEGGFGDGGFSFDSTFEGTLLYDAPNQRMLTSVTSLAMEFAGQVLFSLSGDWKELLLYPLNKNYTWGSVAGTSISCECAPIDSEAVFPVLYVPEDAVAVETSVTVKVNGADVTADKYEFTVKMTSGGAGLSSVVLTIYTDAGTKTVRRFEQNVDLAAGDDASAPTTSVTATYEFSNVKDIAEPAKAFVPNAECTCPKAEISLKVEADFPTIELDDCTASDGCDCPVEADLDFCADVVAWTIPALTDTASVDAFVKTAFDTTFLAVELSGSAEATSDECKESYRIFLCKFYFPSCEDGERSFPAEPDFSKDCGDDFGSTASESSGAVQQYNLAKGEPAVPSDAEDGAASSLAAPVAATLLALTAAV